MTDVTRILSAIEQGDPEASEQLLPLVYNELRRLARRHMRSQNPGHTLQATALLNDVYVQVIDQKRVNRQNRAHFFGAAAQIIRRLLVDHARARYWRRQREDADCGDDLASSPGSRKSINP